MWSGNGVRTPSSCGQPLDYEVAVSKPSTVREINHMSQVHASDTIDEFSREGKMAGVFKDGCIYDGGSSLHMGNSLNGAGGVPNHAGSGYDAGRFHLGNIQANEINMNPRSSFAQQNNMLTQQINMLPQHGNYSMYNMDKFSVASQTTEAHQDGKIGNSVAYTSHQQESSAPMGNASVVQIPRSFYSQHFRYNLATMAEPNNFELMTSQDCHGNLSLPPNVTSSGSLMSSEFPQRMMLNSEILSHYEKLDQNTQIQQSCNAVNQAMYACNNQVVDVAATRGNSRFPTSSASTIHMAEHGKLYGSSESQVRFSDHQPVNMVADEGLQGFMRHPTTASVEEKQVNSGTTGFRLSRHIDTKTSNPYGLDSGQIHSVQEENMARRIGDFATNVSHENQSISSYNGEGMSHTGKSTSLTVGKLWEGTLQLNTSTTISTLAYFRSGEKSTDIDWPQHIEVKGKVRLEAFEKFVQDLPRSRNRALMVISLCWKDGSSESGPTGIKEVARGYNEGQRVGYAQPCSGIDLYVCPRSENIITILAKYGFFKGMQVVEEDQDSLIGCVVWRRNHTPTNIAAPTKFEMNNLPSKNSETSPFEFPLKMAELNPPVSVSKLQYLEYNQTVLPTVNGVQISNFNDQLGYFANAGNGHENNIISPTVGNFQIETTEGHPAMPMQFPATTASSSSQAPANMLDSTIIRAPIPGTLDKSGDDDDLPEFDFGNACGSYQPVKSRNQWPNHQEGFSDDPYKKQVPAEGIMHSSITLLPQPPLPPGPPPISRQMDVSSLQVTSSFLRSFPTQQSDELANRAGEKISKTALTAQAIEGNVSATQGAKPASIWDDDDDDIPEWCPPDMKKTALSQPPLPQLSQTQLPFQPPLPPYPRPPSAVPSRPRSPSQILQQTAELTPTLSSAGSQTQFHVYLPNNQGLPPPRNMAGLLCPGSQNNHPAMTQRPVAAGSLQLNAQPYGICLDETSGSQSSGFESKPYMRTHTDETLGSHSSGFEPNSYHIIHPDGTLGTQSSSGFELKPYHRIHPDETSGIQSSGFEPKPYQRTHTDKTSSGSLPSGFESTPFQRIYPDRTPGSQSSGFEAKPYLRIHPNGTSGSQSSGIEVKPHRRPSPGGRNSDRSSKHWQQGGFDKEHDDDRVYFGHGCNATSRHHQSIGFISKQGRDWSPSTKTKETPKRRRTGFDVLPENINRSSPGFNSKQFSDRQSSPRSPPKQTSRRRRASLFDVKPVTSNMDRRH